MAYSLVKCKDGEILYRSDGSDIESLNLDCKKVFWYDLSIKPYKYYNVMLDGELSMFESKNTIGDWVSKMKPCYMFPAFGTFKGLTPRDLFNFLVSN
jgi:hypothetical protein